ncbi:MAG: DUF305 domain-containing protein [Mesorhizobium amorphae]|nr:MAG: DUF305 domain-containing protein [Mesorhizobium amorphae]
MKTATLALALLLGTAGTTFAQDHSGHHGSHGATGASAEYMDAMQRMDEAMKSMAMTGKAGIDFAEMMIPHHQAAIDMAKSYLASDENDPELTKLSNDIVAAQEREIAQLKEWIARNK